MEYHITKINNDNIYGHSTKHCDASGCNGDDRYLGSSDQLGDLEVGGVYYLAEDGTVYAVEP